MKRQILILAALFLFAHSWATVDGFTFSIDECGIGGGEAEEEAFASGMTLAGIAMLLSVSIISLAYMAGKLTSNPELLVFSKDELTHLIVTAILFVSILSIFAGTCGFFQLFLNHGSPLANSMQFTQGLQIEGKIILKTLIKQGVREKFEAAWVFGYVLPFVGGETSYWDSYHTAFSRQYEILADMVVVGYVAAGVQYYLLTMVRDFVFPIMIPFGLFLRALPFVREAGNTVLALGFALYIILPFAYAANAEAVDDIRIEVLCDYDSEVVLGDCDSITGWGTIATYLFKTVFLPELAMVVFITGAAAMVKVAKVIP